MEIRDAKPSDIDAIGALCLSWWSETPDFLPVPDYEKGKRIIANLIESGVALVAVIDGTIVGACIGGIESLWWSDELFLMDYLTYIRPEHRKGLRIFRLWERFFAEAHRRGLRVYMAHNQAVNSSKKDKLYKRFGMNLTGSSFIGA